MPHIACSVVKTVVYIERQGSETEGGAGRQAKTQEVTTACILKNDTVVQIPGGNVEQVMLRPGKRTAPAKSPRVGQLRSVILGQ